MDGDRRICALIAVLLFLIQDYGSCSEILQGPQNVTVLTGSNASFTCTVTAGWSIISWYLQDTFAVGISSNSGVQLGIDNIVVRNSTSSINGAFTSEITIINVNKSNSGIVRCSSLSALFQDAYLSVQVKGSIQITNGSVTVTPNTTISMVCRASEWYPGPIITWEINNTVASNSYYSTDKTTGVDSFVTAVSTFQINPGGDTNLTCLASIVTLDKPQSATVSVTVREIIPGSSSSLSQTAIILIAVFASIGGLLLLIVIIAVIVLCCCRKETETSYQSDAWKAPKKNISNPRTLERNGLGERNSGYTPEPIQRNSGYTPEPIQRNSGYTPEPIQRNYGYTPEPLQRNSGYTPEPIQRNYGYTPEPLQRNSGYTPEPIQRNYGYTPEPIQSNYGYTPEPTSLGQSFRSTNVSNSDMTFTSRSYTPQDPVPDENDHHSKTIRHVTHV